MDSPAGRNLDVLNVTSGETRLFDLLFERLLQSTHRSVRALGAGLARPRGNWTDTRIDCPRTRTHLSELGFNVPPPALPACLWSGDMRPGLFPRHTALFHDRAAHPLSRLVLVSPAHNPVRPRAGRGIAFT